MTTAERVKRLRTEKGWTKLELATRTGLSDSHICQIESGRRNPTVPTLRKLAESFGVSVEILREEHHVGRNIRESRMRMGLTMKDVELRSGLSTGHLCKIEKGVRRRVSPETLQKISECLRTTPEELMVSSA